LRSIVASSSTEKIHSTSFDRSAMIWFTQNEFGRFTGRYETGAIGVSRSHKNATAQCDICVRRSFVSFFQFLTMNPVFFYYPNLIGKLN
jgi:hypothetical protein